MDRLNWQKSSYSGEETNCVEIASDSGLVYIRESDDPSQIISTTPAKLNAWINAAKAGAYNHLTI